MRSMQLLKALLATVILVATAQTAMAGQTSQRSEAFDVDPGWDGVNNRIVAAVQPIVRQDFGWTATDYAGGESGEIGGVVWRSLRPAYYAKAVGPFSLDDSLEFSGAFSISQVTAINQWHSGSCVWVGFFNSERQSWRPIDQLGFRLLGHRDYEFSNYAGIPVGAMVEMNYGVKSYAAGGDFLKNTGEESHALMRDQKQDDMLRIMPDGKRHTWKFNYDPNGNDGNGTVQFSIDGGPAFRMGIRDNHRVTGATFNRFGIFNEQLPGYQITAFFDDVTINGEPQDFSQDPGWEGVGNQVEFIDDAQYGGNDFGYSPTNFAGGEKSGEVGGRIWQVHADQPHLKGFVGGDTGRLTLDDKLVARGKISFPMFGTDAGMQFGWFNAAEQGWPTTNFVGAYLDSYSNVGRFISPQYGAASENGGTGPCQILFVPDGRVYDYELVYDPEAAEGNGAVTLTLGGETQTLELKPGTRKEGAIMNRFGLFNVQGNNGKYSEVYMDDIEYTVKK